MFEKINFIEKNQITSITPLLKGWSKDHKYVLEDARGSKYLLRISSED